MRVVRDILVILGVSFLAFLCITSITAIVGRYARIGVDLPKVSIEKPEDQLGARPQSMVTQPASVVAPAARSAVGGSMTIDGETLELPGMKGPFYREEGRFPSMWSDEGAEVLVQGTVWIQADDYVEWSPDGTNWNKITLNVSEYGQIPTGKIRVRIKNIAGPTYWKLVEFPPE